MIVLLFDIQYTLSVKKEYVKID